MVMHVLARGIKDISPWCMLYADDIVLCGTRSEVVEKKLEEWRRAMEDRGLKINRKKTVYLRFNVDLTWMMETRMSIYKEIIWNE